MKYRIENLSKCLTPSNTKRCSTNHTACPVSFRFCLLLFQRIEQYGRLKWWTEFGGSLNRNEWYRRRWHFMDFNTFFSTLHSTFYLFLFYTQCIYFNSHNVIQCIIIYTLKTMIIANEIPLLVVVVRVDIEIHSKCQWTFIESSSFAQRLHIFIHLSRVEIICSYFIRTAYIFQR